MSTSSGLEGAGGARTALISTLIGTYIAAYVLFPRNPAPRGALMASGIVLAAAILIVPLMRLLKRGSPGATNAENFVAAGYIAWLLADLIQGAYDLNEAKDQSLRYALLAIGLSASAMWLGASFKPWQLPNWVTSGLNVQLSTEVVATAVPICFLLGMFNFLYSVNFDVPLMFSYLGRERWSMPWGRGQLGGWESFRDQAQYFGFVLPSLAALLIARRGLFNFQSLFAVACSLLMLLFLSTGGGRRIVAVTGGAALVVWVQATGGLRFRNIVLVTVGALAMAYAAQFMLNIRSRGYDYYARAGTEYDYLHVDDNFLRLAQVIELVPDRRPFVEYRQLVFTLIRPIPRVLWPGKPLDAGFDLPTEVGLKGVSLSSSIIGEWYISYGWLTVLLGGYLHGRFAATANSLREIGHRTGNPIVYSLTVMVLLAGMRSMQDLVLMSYALIAWWAVSRYTVRRVHSAAPVYGQ